MMTMLMFNNMAGSSNGGSGGRSDKNMFTMIYVFLATSVVDFIFKNAPLVLNFFMKKYNDKLETIKKDLASTTKDLTDNKIKKKTASITVTINVNSPDNILGQSLLDYITNNKNTTHVSYIRENFILNQKDVINLEDEVFARMTQSTSTDQGGLGSTSTNNGSGAGGSGGQSSIVQVIEIYSFTKTTDELRAFLENIKQKYTINVKNKLGNKRYFFNMHPLQVPMDIDKRKDLSRLPPNFAFIMKHFQTNRKFSNLFGEDIDTIRNRVNFFIKNRKWYDEKGIPYTLGLLLSGSPGTGKTSTIKCLANETNRHICNVNLNNDMTKTQLENLFFNENINILNPSTGQNETYCIPLDQRIYVLEDVDCQSDIVMERALKNEKNEKNKKNGQNEQDPKGDGSVDRKVLEHYEDKHKVDLSFLLNLLDGVLENPGRIVIMTSNFPDMLDTALIRPGRIDVIAKFRNCSNKTVVDMLEFFYDIKLSEEERERVFQFKEEMVTPAELSKVMFENFSDYEASIRHMENLSIELEKKQKELAEKESKEPLQLGISEQPFSIGATMDMSSYPPTPIYTPLPGDMIPAGEPNTEVGFSEKKGDVIDDDKYQDKYTAIRRRIEEDTTYVFINNIAEQYVSSDKKNRKWEDFMYYSNLLQTRVFNLKEYVDFANECASQCKGVVECVDNLRAQKESLNIEGKLRHNILVYEFKLNQFFSPTRMMTTGLKQQMIRDRMTSLMDDGPVLGSQLSALSNQFGDANPLNTSSYSAF
jgi:DNA polymerase III delta prime subunit